MRSSRLLQFICTFLVLYFIVPTTATAQVTGVAGLKYSTHAENPGLFLGAYLPVAGVIEAGGEFTYYFVGDDGFGNLSIWSIDINGRYPIPLESSFRLFAVGGINITHWGYDSGFEDNPFFDFATSATETGLNLGGVVEFGGEDFGFFAGATLVVGGASGLNIGGGVRKRF